MQSTRPLIFIRYAEGRHTHEPPVEVAESRQLYHCGGASWFGEILLRAQRIYDERGLFHSFCKPNVSHPTGKEIAAGDMPCGIAPENDGSAKGALEFVE